MTALAQAGDLIAKLGRDLTPDESNRVDGVLDDASAAVTAYTRRAFLPTDTVLVTRLVDSYVRLQRPVITITRVEIPTDLQAQTWLAVPYLFDGVDRLSIYTNLDSVLNLPFQVEIAHTARITYTYGYAAVPDDVISVVCSAAARQLQSPVTTAGFGVTSQTQTSGPFSQGLTFSAAAVSGSVYLTPNEQTVLDQYRVTATSLALDLS